MSNGPEPRGPRDPDSRKTHWLETKRTGNRIFWGLVALCAALGPADFVYDRHTVFGFEGIPLAYAVFGFVCFFGIVLSGYPLRRLVGRDEDYYDR